MPSTIIPLGEFAPDLGDYGEGTNRLLDCYNLVPVYGNYCSSPAWDSVTGPLPKRPMGLHAISTGYNSYLGYYGDATDLYRITPIDPPPWTTLNITRLVGGAYNTAGTGGENGWQFTSFGRNEIATNYVDDVQLVTPGAANAVKLMQSGGGNPGMDPKAKFVGSIRNNLAVANCNLSALYDGLAAGAHPNLVAWSQSDNIRQFGSFNADPQLIGSGYQEVLNDYGDITGFLGADDFAIIAQQRGFTRMDGPPYQFRTIVSNIGTRFPNALRRFGGDVYGFGPGGPFVLLGGEAPLTYLGDQTVVRTLVDNTTNFSPDYAINPGIDIKYVSLAIDPTNKILQYSITSRSRQSFVPPGVSQEGNLTIWYNIEERRFSFARSAVSTDAGNFVDGLLFLANRPDTGDTWMPGRTGLAIAAVTDDLGGVIDRVAVPTFKTSIFNPFPRFAKPYIQLDPETVTRIERVRPIYASGSGAAVTTSVTIRSRSRTYDPAAVYGPYSDQDSHGYVVTPTTGFDDLHSIQVDMGAGTDDVSTINQLVGIQVWYQTGGRYAR